MWRGEQPDPDRVSDPVMSSMRSKEIKQFFHGWGIHRV
jgi:hypothetical protein